MKRQYKERRLYFSEKCTFPGCEKSFQSFKRSRIKGGLCRFHRTHKPDPNQQELFSTGEAELLPKRHIL